MEVSSQKQEDSRAIETKARPVCEGCGYTLVEVHLITGRTHQIRAHLASAGYPVIGDEKYGDRAVNRKIQDRYGLSSQFLHAYRLRFADAIAPLEYLKGREFTAPLPPLLETVKEGLFDGAKPAEDRRPARDRSEHPARGRSEVGAGKYNAKNANNAKKAKKREQ